MEAKDKHGNGALVMLPIVHHRISLEYVKNKLIAVCIRLPIRCLIAISYYVVHSSFLLRRSFNVQRKRINVPSRQSGRTIRADVYTPASLSSTSSSSSSPLPVHINWHGSGFVLDCFGADGEMCAYLANKMHCLVIDADYRKSPEHPYPAAVQDAEDMFAYVLSKPTMFDANRVSVGGSSAGACLALAVGVSFGRRVSAVACIAPPTDFRPESRPKVAPEANHPRALPRRVTLWFDKCYLVPHADRANPTLSPSCASLASDQLTANVVYIATGMGDTLYQDANRLIRSLNEQGHPRAILRSVKGEGHGFEKALRGGEQKEKAKAVFDEIASLVQQSWSAPPPKAAL